MFYVKWFFILAFWLIVAAFFHYTLPQVDIARITDTYEKRQVPGANSLFWTRGANEGRAVSFLRARV